jgi:hypothetical protein
MGTDIDLIGKKRLEAIVDAALTKKAAKKASKEVYAEIGRALISMGIEADADMKSPHVVMPSLKYDFKIDPIRAGMALSVTQSKTISDQVAEKRGKEFWEVFKQKALKQLCGDEGAMKLVREGKVKEALIAALPPILAAAGLTAIFIPVVATIVAGLVMLLLQAGIESVCELYYKKA